MCHKEVFHQFLDQDYQRINWHQHQDSFDEMKLYLLSLKSSVRDPSDGQGHSQTVKNYLVFHKV